MAANNMPGELPGGVPAAAGPNPLRAQEAIHKPNPRSKGSQAFGDCTTAGQGHSGPLTLRVGGGREQFLGERKRNLSEAV